MIDRMFCQVMENNPQLAQVLNDPATMRQYLDMARNPEVRVTMMFSTIDERR